MKANDLALVGSLSFVIGLWLGLILGGSLTEVDNHASAIKAGVGEYYLDSNNNRQFRWKPSQP